MPPLSRTISIKADVDTYRGLKEGVPALLDIMEKHSVKGTFFVSFGPDNSGKAVWNIFKKGFLKKMVRTKAAKLYGIRTMLYGTILPAPVISAKLPDIIKSIADARHEVGVHAWDHRLWQDHLDELTIDKIRSEFEKSFEAFRKVLGCEPKSTAAPAWFCNKISLGVQDSLNLDYCSDCRTGTPFYPRIGATVFKTLQVPTNQPCIEEIIGTAGVNDDNLLQTLISSLDKSVPNIVPVHAEVEGGVYRKQFSEFLKKTLNAGYRYETLTEVAHKHRDAPVKDLVYKNLPGRSGLVAMPAK